MVDGQKVYHENQRSSLCGQHTINSALQAPIFNQHALNQFADRLRHTEILKRNPYCDEFGVNFIPLNEIKINNKNCITVRDSFPRLRWPLVIK